MFENGRVIEIKFIGIELRVKLQGIALQFLNSRILYFRESVLLHSVIYFYSLVGFSSKVCSLKESGIFRAITK